MVGDAGIENLILPRVAGSSMGPDALCSYLL